LDFFNYIHAVGTGLKGNRDLTFEESKDMMTQILDQSVPNEQIAAFLLGWRLKPETTEEFRGALAACDANIKKSEIKNSIELGYPFDGKAKNPYIFPLIAKVLENNGLNLVVASDERQPAKNGITIKEIIPHINLTSNLHYFDRKDFFPKMHKLTDMRNRLGLRTSFSTIEKLSGVAQSDFAITGIFHKPFVKKYSAILQGRYKKIALIQGNEGTPELFSKGRLWIVDGDSTKEYIIDPEYFGILYKKSWDKITLKESLDQLNNPSDEYLKLAELNAAIYLFISDNAQNIEEAYEKVKGTIASI